MGFDARHDHLSYTLAELPPTRHVVLTPAVRWRVVVEQVKEIEHDVILDAVLRIRAAGETSPTRIADLLQLPEDLVRHLLVQAVTARMRVTEGGHIEAGTSGVAWIYRDLATGELWPHPAKEVPPLPLRIKTRHRAQFKRGTAGRPIPVECLLMDTSETTVADPTRVELARFSRATADTNCRTALVSSSETCLVASPVMEVAGGHVIATPRGVPHLSLTQLLGRLSQEQEPVRRWLADVPKAPTHPEKNLPLHQAAAELRGFTAEYQTFSPTTILSRIELCLSRFVDQFQYLYGIRPDATIDTGAAILIGERAGLSRDSAIAMARSERGTAGHRVLRLLLAKPDGDTALLQDLVEAAADFTRLASAPELSPVLEKLIHKTIDVCDRLLIASEGADVKQAG